MGLGAWLAAITDRKVFEVEEKRQRKAIRAKPAAVEEEIYEVFDEYEVDRMSMTPLVDKLVQNFEMWVKVSHFCYIVPSRDSFFDMRVPSVANQNSG